MTRERLNELLKVTGDLIPEAMEEHIGDLETDAKELLPRETLLEVLNTNQVPEAKQQALLDALDAANAVPELVELAHIMAKDAVRGLVRCHAVEFYQPLPDCLTGFDSCTPSCVCWKAGKPCGPAESRRNTTRIFRNG